MKVLLPNARWVCLNSELLGEDWWEKCQMIDDALVDFGMDLSEESAFLIYDGRGGCEIARPVIGAKRVLPEPFKIKDWIASNVEVRSIAARAWDEVFKEVSADEKPFILRLKRKLRPALELDIEVIFSE